MRPTRDNYRYLTSAPVERVVLTMAVPTIVSMLVTALYSLADTYFVSRLNTQSTAAVGIVFSVMSMVQAVGFFFGHGSGNYMSRQLGARHRDKALTMSAVGLVCSFVSGVVVALGVHAFLSPLSAALGSTATIQPYTEEYLGLLLWGAPLLTSSLTLNNQMRLQGNAGYALVGILTGAVLNLLLDPLFIFALGLGLRGAALATVLSQAVSCVLLWYMSGRGGGLRPRLGQFHPSWQLAREICNGGTPSLLRQGLSGLSVMALNVAASQFGDGAIAGMSVVSRVCWMVFAAVVGLGQGFQPLCGFCYGAGLYDRVKAGFFFSVRLGTYFLLACSLVGVIFAPGLIRLFRDEASVVSVGAAALRWQMLTFVLLPTIGLTNMFLQTIGRPVSANLAAAARSGLFFIPLVFVLPSLFGLTGLVACQAASDVCSFVVCALLARRALVKMGPGVADSGCHST